MDRPGALAELRAAVTRFAGEHTLRGSEWCVALSGGPDSLALTAAAAAVRPTTALIVDHRLQQDSAEVARTARAQALTVGCVAARILRVEVGAVGGPEAAARSARYAALDEARAGAAVLLAHTLDDQAETVLLGLGRGSGPRSIAGMRSYDPPWGRPLLGVRRAVTAAACAELQLTPWSDPHNTDARFTRVRLRTEVLPLLEDVLGGGVAEALARTADALRADGDLTLSLVATNMDEAIIGHIAFSPVSISDGTKGWYAAGPVSVMPTRQRTGIGSQIATEGIERMTAMGAKGIVLLGDPGYYARFGFQSFPDLILPGVPPKYFQMRALTTDPLPKGTVEYAPGFSVRPKD